MLEKISDMLDELKDQLAGELMVFNEAVDKIHDAEALYELQIRFLGKKGSISLLRRQMGKLSPDQRKAAGQAFNATKAAIEEALEMRRTALKELRRTAELARTADLSFVVETPGVGSLHPITQTRLRLESIFQAMGFSIEDGPHIEHQLYNFDKLNILSDHPARDMQDTFFIQGREGSRSQETPLVLRTHTSPVQIRTMLERRPPVRIICPGAVFRRDDDPTHSPMFNQIEGLYVDSRVTMADLKATLLHFIREFFEADLAVRFRPSYFPFVEPGAEFDIQCPFCTGKKSASCGVCKNTTWLEIGGSGMVHPRVFEAVGYDPRQVSGWAFGFGIDRMAMLRYRVPELRLFFENDLRVLEQFPC